MKKLLCILLALAFCFGTTALAEPNDTIPPENDPADTAAPEETSFTLITLQSQGEAVTRIQYRLMELGYMSYRPTGNFGQMSRTAVIDFQVRNELMSDGTVGAQSYAALFRPECVRAGMNTSLKPPSGPSLKDTASEAGVAADWATEVDAALAMGKPVTVVDYNSDTSFSMKRVGGVNHADMETVSAEDTAQFIKAFGGGFSYEKRSALVKVDGKVYAASLSGWPSGEDTVADNSMEGSVCLFFSGSLSDVLSIRDPEHDAQVTRATSTSGSYAPGN